MAGEAREEVKERVRWLLAILPCHSLAAALHWALWHNYCRRAAGSGTLIGFPAAVPSDWLWEKFPSLTPPSRLPSAYSREGFSFQPLQALHPSLEWSGGPRFRYPHTPDSTLGLLPPRYGSFWPPEPTQGFLSTKSLSLFCFLRRHPGNSFPMQLWPSSQSLPTNSHVQEQLGTSGFHSLPHLCT